MAVLCSRPKSAVSSIGLNCYSSRSKWWRLSGTPCLPRNESRRAPAAMLLDIKGIGPEFAATLWSEGLFRHFDNRRQVSSYAGLAPTPWQSGSVDREQGVSKAGNPRLRTTLIQLAWLWLRHQPQSALALWFEDRVQAEHDGRLKKTAIMRWRAVCCRRTRKGVQFELTNRVDQLRER